MRYIKSYKIFESSDYFKTIVDMDIIQDLKDISLEYLDDGYIISYAVKSIHPELVDYTLLMGQYQLVNDKIPSDISDIQRNYLIRQQEVLSKWEHWTNYKPEYIEEAKKNINKYGLTYLFRIYSIGPSGDSRDHVINKEAQLDILYRIRGMYPNEKIENI